MSKWTKGALIDFPASNESPAPAGCPRRLGNLADVEDVEGVMLLLIDDGAQRLWRIASDCKQVQQG